MNLFDKVVVVSGGSDGIGKHICLKLAALGCRLAILGRSENRLSVVADEAIANGALEVRSYSFDLEDSTELDRVALTILSDFGGVDILVNNAGVWHRSGPVEKVDVEALNSTVQTNLTALMQLTCCLLPQMRTRREPAIINISSKAGVTAQAGQAIYSATKYGVRGFTDVLKLDEAQHGVRIAGVYQGSTKTQMFAKAGDQKPDASFSEPEDIADVVAFMLSRPEKLWLHEVHISR